MIVIFCEDNHAVFLLALVFYNNLSVFRFSLTHLSGVCHLSSNTLIIAVLTIIVAFRSEIFFASVLASLSLLCLCSSSQSEECLEEWDRFYPGEPT